MRKEFLPESAYHLEITGSSEALEPEIKYVSPKLAILSNESFSGSDLNRVTLAGPSDREIGEKLIKHLSSLPNFKLRSLHCQEANLEDIFLAATRRSWEIREEDPDRLTAAPFRKPHEAEEEDIAEEAPSEPEEAESEKEQKEDV